MSAHARRWLACLCLVGSAALGPARSLPAADRLYEWKAADGSLHITESAPPPDAVLVREYDAVATPAAQPAAPAVPPPPVRAAAPSDDDSCDAHAKLVKAWLDAALERQHWEHEITRLENDPVLASESSCTLSALHCGPSYFNRDVALDRARERRSQAEFRQSAAEDAARRAGVPDRCLVEPDG
ncbi:MAG TPA: hypothetical protein VMR31_04005 [Myxococcota bacterium]|nr:hypothetical protein [Myxococcota bacterium]